MGPARVISLPTDAEMADALGSASGLIPLIGWEMKFGAARETMDRTGDERLALTLEATPPSGGDPIFAYSLPEPLDPLRDSFGILLAFIEQKAGLAPPPPEVRGLGGEQQKWRAVASFAGRVH